MKKFLHHYFFPHHSNNFKARLLHSVSIFFYIVLLLFFQTTFGWAKRLQPNVLGYATDITVEKILSLVNREREKTRLSPLALSPVLSTAATAKAEDMFTKNYWAHVSPTGTTPWDFITRTGYTYVYAGENLAKSFDTAEDVVEAWMASSTHRANILKPEYADIGLSIMNGKLQGEETTLVVQEFGTQASRTLAISREEVKENVIPQGEKTVAPNPAIIASSHKKSFSLRTVPKNISLFLVEFLLIILFIDSIYMWKTGTTRLSGNSLAHIIFFASLIGAMGATGIGAIL